MSQGKEKLACMCGCDTFNIANVFYGDNITSPGTTDTIIYCNKCEKIWTPKRDLSKCDHKWDTCNVRFACDQGEECWFKSDDFKNSMDDL